MGRWRNKWENAPVAPSMDLTPFNQRLFDPVNALISHSDKLELQSLAQAAASGDPKAVQAYQERLWNSGLTQDEKLALGEMFQVAPQKGKGKIKASPQDMPGEQPIQRADGILPGSDNWWDDPKYRDMINKERQSGWDGAATEMIRAGGYQAAKNKADKEGLRSFDYQMTPEEMAALREKYGEPAGYATWTDSAYVDQGKKKGKGKVKASPQDVPPQQPPKKSAKERMQERYNVKPRLAGRGYTEY